MALPDLVTIRIKQGDSFSRTIQLLEDDGTTPIDLTGASVEFSMAKGRGKSPSWTWVDDPDRALITSPAQGEIRWGLFPGDTRAVGKYEVFPFEVTVTFADGTRLTVLDGEFDMRLETAHDEEVSP